MDASPPTVPFRCPICRCQVYKLFAPSPKAAPRSPVYECHGCSVLFTDPERFTRFDPHPTAKLHPAPDLTRGWRS